MATIIKRESAHEALTGQPVRDVAFDLTDLAGHADEYLAGVQQEAVKIVQQARAEAVAIKQQAEQAGRAAAEAAVERILDEKVAQQMQTIKPALEALVAQMADARGAWLDQWDKSAVKVAGKMAARVVRRELSELPETTLTWVREALQLAAGSNEITVRLNPTDHENLGKQVEEIATSMSNLAPARLVSDGAVAAGGCVVETQYGVIDQQVESQLERLVEEMC